MLIPGLELVIKTGRIMDMEEAFVDSFMEQDYQDILEVITGEIV